MNIRVYVEVDYGYSNHLWTTPFQTTDELIAWWQELPSANEYTYKPDSLPGDVAYLDMDPEDGFDPNGLSSDKRNQLPYIHLCFDHYSYMKVNDKFYRHAGYTPESDD